MCTLKDRNMDSVFWILFITHLCFNIGFSYGFNDPTRISVPLPLVHSGHLVKRNSQTAPPGAPVMSPPEGSTQQNRPPSLGTQVSPNQETTQPRSDSPSKSVSSSSNDSEPSTSKHAIVSKPRLPTQTRKPKIHKSSRPPKPDSDKASLSDESIQNRAQLPRRPSGRPGPPGMQPERQQSHSHNPSAYGAHSHGPAHHGPQHQLGSQYPPAPPAGNPPEIVEVEPGAHVPPRYPSDPQMGSKPPIVVMTGPPSKPSIDPNPLSWEEITEFLKTPVLSDLFSGFGWSVGRVKAVFRKLPILLDKIEAE